MTKALYLEDCYLYEMDATVLRVDGKQIELDQTCFYPSSGGQPTDLGVLKKGDEVFTVLSVCKKEGKILHEVDTEGLQVGDVVHGKIDWDRRYRLMRYHTAAHLLSGVVHNETGAKITGNQLKLDKARIDFNLDMFDRAQLATYQEKANSLVQEERNVEILFLPRKQAFEEIPSLVKLDMKFPEHIAEVRIIDIVGFDQQACGGCHVKNIKEIGKITITKAENKGKHNRRVYFTVS